jgi:hypothetical protein
MTQRLLNMESQFWFIRMATLKRKSAWSDPLCYEFLHVHVMPSLLYQITRCIIIACIRSVLHYVLWCFWVQTTLSTQLSNRMAYYFGPLNSVRERSDRLLGLWGWGAVSYCVGNWLVRAHDFLQPSSVHKTSNTVLDSPEGINLFLPAV